jgi:hypothetical protein
MTYLIIYKNTASYTNWYDYENNYIEGMIVVNLLSDKFTIDGINWNEVKQDHL